MVKGVSKRVIIVKSPDVRFFEQAIFIVKDDALGKAGVTAERVLEEACRVADCYVKENSTKPSLLSRIKPLLWCSAGALTAILVWIVMFWL